MTDERLTVSGPLTEKPEQRGRWLRYLGSAIAINGVLWGVALSYLNNVEPVYTSDWTITLPGPESYTNVNLPDIGAASSRSVSAYENRNQDPRENYKFVAGSASVRQRAANQLGVSPSEVNGLRIEIIPNTSLMRFSVSADTPEEAQNKALALHEALEYRLAELRKQEAEKENANLEAALQAAQTKLDAAQQRLSSYQASTGFASNEQIVQLLNNIENLRRQRAETLADLQRVSAQYTQLSGNLALSPNEATDAFALQADPLFQQYQQEYSTATADLTVMTSKLGPNHPSVVRARAKEEAARLAVLERSQAILGRSVDAVALARLSLNGGNDSRGTARETFFQNIVTSQADLQGLQAQAGELQQQIQQLEGRLETLSRYSSQVESLRRDLQVSEAVFSSTLASLDLGRTNGNGSYPQIQLLADPSLPDDPTSPKTKLVLLGALMGSTLVTLGLLLLWLRKRRFGGDRLRSANHPEMRPLPESVPADQWAGSSTAIQE
jgi:uncharacterized protein involved in exopolysaccharide biosynthesis